MNLNTTEVITIDSIKEKIESLSNKPYTRSRAKKINRLYNTLKSMLPQQKLSDVVYDGVMTYGTYVGNGESQIIFFPSKPNMIAIRKEIQ